MYKRQDLGFEWIPEGYEVGDNGWADGKKNRLVCIYDQEGHRIDVNVVQYSEKTIHKFDSEESRKKMCIRDRCAIITSSFFVWTPALLFHVIKTLSTKECNIIFASTKVKL